MDRHGGPVWDEEAFDRAAGGGRAPSCAAGAADVLADAVRVLEAWRQTDRLLSGSVDLMLLPAMTDMRAQVGRLVRRGFVADVGRRPAAPAAALPGRGADAPREARRRR